MHPYAWRLWFRRRLPWFLIDWGVASKGKDCEAAGASHHWSNRDYQTSACYYCEIVRPGQLWRKPQFSAMTPDESLSFLADVLDQFSTSTRAEAAALVKHIPSTVHPDVMAVLANVDHYIADYDHQSWSLPIPLEKTRTC